MSEFLEERLPQDVLIGASWQEDYEVEVTRTASGQEFRALRHPFPARRVRVSYVKTREKMGSELAAFYHRVYGRLAGFRVRAIDDYSTNGASGAPTAFDHPTSLVSDGVYQLQKRYGLGASGLSIGYPVRTIFKPVAGTVLVGLRNALSGDRVVTSAVSINTTNGRVTFPANKQRAITGITQAAQAVVTVGVGHPFVVGESIHFSGVVGMIEINGRRADIVSTTSDAVTVNLSTAAFTAYASGGTTNTRPQAGEEVWGGCLFDIPCRFDSSIEIRPVSPDFAETGEVDILELVSL